MATKFQTKSSDQPDPSQKSERVREDAKERAAREAKLHREQDVAKLVTTTIGMNSRRRLTCHEVGLGRFRVNLVEKTITKASEFLEENHISHSWMIWSDGRAITKSEGDVPLVKIN